MEELIKSLKNLSKASKLRNAWSDASNYPNVGNDSDVDWSPANQYVSMLERKVIEQNGTIEILYDKIEALEKLRKQWANGEIEN